MQECHNSAHERAPAAREGSVVQRTVYDFLHQEEACQEDYSDLVAAPAGIAAKTFLSDLVRFQFFHGTVLENEIYTSFNENGR